MYSCCYLFTHTHAILSKTSVILSNPLYLITPKLNLFNRFCLHQTYFLLSSNLHFSSLNTFAHVSWSMIEYLKGIFLFISGGYEKWLSSIVCKDDLQGGKYMLLNSICKGSLSLHDFRIVMPRIILFLVKVFETYNTIGRLVSNVFWIIFGKFLERDFWKLLELSGKVW